LSHSVILGQHLKLLGKRRGVCTKVAFAIQNQQYLWNEAVYSCRVKVTTECL